MLTSDYQEHLANRDRALDSGVLNSGSVTGRKAAVLGSPVGHSRSPQLHLAAYRALGLTDWTYERIECTGEELPTVVGAFGPEWVGVSVTMPGKVAALRFADERTERAELVGSANTLVRTEAGWRADNTDIDGVTGALADRGDLRRAIVLGSGGAAPAAVAALAGLGVTDLVVAARNRQAAERLVDLGSQLGVSTSFHDVSSRRDQPCRTGRRSGRHRSRPTPPRRLCTGSGRGAGAARRHLRPVADSAGASRCPA